MNTLQIWVAASRPKTLPISIGPALTGTLLAFSEGFFHPMLFLMTIATALGLQICANFANDYFDFMKGADTNERKGPLRVTQAGLVSLDQMKKALMISLTITACLGCCLVWYGGFFMAVLVAISLLCAVLYTGGPFPLAYLGLGDLFVFLFFGPIATLGAYFLQTASFSWDPILLGIGSGMLSVTPLVVNNIRDEQEDFTADKKTLVVRFGKRFGQMEYLFCLALGALVPFLFCKQHPFCLISLLFIIPACFSARSVLTYTDPKELNAVLAKTGQVVLLYHILFCLGWIAL
ncbi:MAG: 1,4-dihydroxy-2-naphthoate polyprenyltransferase [Rhabdochlamydiaceae bacterium]|nr:1,4-dihydroxy-2-naphthoate polyprenyltransferase [Rhabdochlamydiaceae bacterium]